MILIRANIAAETPLRTLVGPMLGAAGEFGMINTGSSDLS